MLTRKRFLIIGTIVVAAITLGLAILSGAIFPYSSNEFGYWGTWYGSIATTASVLFAVVALSHQVKQFRLAQEHETKKEASARAIEKYVEICRGLMSISHVPSDFIVRELTVFADSYDNLKDLEDLICMEHDQKLARVEYRMMLTNLKKLSKKLCYFHFYYTELTRKGGLRDVDYSVPEHHSDHSKLLLNHWFNHFVDRYDFNQELTFGYNNDKCSPKDLYSLYSLLVSSPLSLIDRDVLEEEIETLKKEKHLNGISDHLWNLEQYSPQIMTYLMLYGDCIKTTKNSTQMINIEIYGYEDSNQLDDVWFWLERNSTRTHYYLSSDIGGRKVVKNPRFSK